MVIYTIEVKIFLVDIQNLLKIWINLFLNELETGDIGYRNLRGNFFITGKKK